MPIKKRKKNYKTTPKKELKEKRKTYIFLFIIIFIALFLRLYQPDWYNDRQFHPDERWITSYAVPNLHFWGKPIGLQYGSLPLYILATYKDLVNWWNKHFRIKDMNRAKIGGARIISGLVDTLTIIFIFLIGSLLFNRKIGVFSALLLTFTVLHIQAAHFFTVDPFLTLFATITVYFSVRIYKYGKPIDYILSGVFYGAAIASKTSGLPLFVVILTAHLLYFFSIKGKTKKEKKLRKKAWIYFGLTILISALAFFIFMPYAILDYKKFIKDQNYQKNILVTGKGDVPYNRQYINTTPYFYYIKNLIFYTMGIPYGSIAFLAWLFYVFIIIKKLKNNEKIEKEILIIFSWIIPYFLIVGNSFAKFNRYMLPLTPFLALLTSKFIYDLYDFFKDKKYIATITKYFVLIGTIFYGIAFMNVYFNSHPWIQASRWIYKNIPTQIEENGQKRRTVILNEMWGDDLPVYVEGKSIGLYRNLKWALQEREDNDFLKKRKLDELSTKLSQVDYVFMADKRAYGTYQRLPEKFPINYFYYKTMLNNPEKLGFKKVHEVEVYPSFLGITIKDDYADESFQLYDHPHVYIFKNEKYLSQQKLREILYNGMKEVMSKYRKKGMGNPNLGELRDKIIILPENIAVFIWYILIQILSFVVFPLHFIIFKNLKDKGYGLSKILSIFLFAYINWILVSFNIWKFYQGNLLILLSGFIVIGCISYVYNKEKINLFFKENTKHILYTEIIFLSAYLFFIFIKLYTSDIHNVSGHGYNGGGEPMGMAYLSGIFNDITFPPHDPWLAGFTLNYYYWGQLLLATLSKTIGILPEVSYNLSLSLLFALSFLAAFILTYNITGKYKYGIFGGFLLALSGNFHTLSYIFEKILNSNNFRYFINEIIRFQFIWDPTRIYPTPVITEVPFFSYLYGDLHAHNIVIPFTVLLIALLYNIFNFDKKDLFENIGNNLWEKIINIFFISLLVGVMWPMNTWNYPPIVIFSLIILFIIIFKIYIQYYLFERKIKPPQKIFKSIELLFYFFILSFIIVSLSYILFIPFHNNFVSPYKPSPKPISKAERVSVFVMFKYFSIFFIILFAYLLFLWSKGIELFIKKTTLLKIKTFSFKNVKKHLQKVIDKIFEDTEIFVFSIVFVIGFIIDIILFFIQPTFGILFFILITTIIRIIKTTDKKELFSLIGIFLSTCIIWGTEIYFLGDGRMNTVFKFYMVVWTILSISIPYLLYIVLNEYKKVYLIKNKNIWKKTGIIVSALLFLLLFMYLLFYLEKIKGLKYFSATFIIIIMFSSIFLHILKDKIGKYIFIVSFIFILLPAILYPFLGAYIKMFICSNGFKQKPRINGIKYMKTLNQRPGSTYDFDKYDYDVIKWIQDNMEKIEPILETPGERMYSGVSRISIFTGMPTIVGWAYQVAQQSGRGIEVNIAKRDANIIYRTDDISLCLGLLQKYNVKYIYVGNIEKRLYGNKIIDKFNKFATPIYKNEQAILYKIYY